MEIKVIRGDLHLIDLKTRLPFKYGIATMTRAPHAFVRVEAEIDGHKTCGVAADHLPPKWFTKIPDQPLDAEIDEMLASIEHAVSTAVGLQDVSAYAVWKQLDAHQRDWGTERNFPPLLSNFGTTLVERALIEAVCKVADQSFGTAVRRNIFGLQLADFDERMAHQQPGDLLCKKPRGSIIVRHTIGMADPLCDDDIPEADRLNDSLPQSLAACIDRYGMRHFKIKLSGDADTDIARLEQIAHVISDHAPPDYAFTMDGNEQFHSLDSFHDFWETLLQTETLQPFFAHLLFVEQPFHRDLALNADTLGDLRNWAERPVLVIDESDAEQHSFSSALTLGYHGTSHKNCKGVFKGIANACLLAKVRQEHPEGTYIMSGEDLANIGPIALQQDLAVAAALGIATVERNGHHYFAGLSAFPSEVQQQVLAAHPDLYAPSSAGWPTLNIQKSKLPMDSVNQAPLGVGFELDVEQFLTVDQWRCGH